MQIKWLNDYNVRCLKEVGEDILRAEGKQAAYEWVKARTQPIDRTSTSSAIHIIQAPLACIMGLLATLLFVRNV